MTINHHPDVSTLMSCAAGSQPEAVAAVMAAHISMCKQCAAELGHMEEIGAALFEDVSPASIAKATPMLAEARARESDGDGATGTVGRRGDVPAPIAALVGSDLDTIPWKRLVPGVWHYAIPLSKGAKGCLRLIKVSPGTSIPEHGHGGAELTLTLKGSYQDRFGVYRRGDVADLDGDVEHQPVADPLEGCICLVASESKARFKSLFARLVQPLTGL